MPVIPSELPTGQIFCSKLGLAALQSLLKRHANKPLMGNPLFFCPAAHGV